LKNEIVKYITAKSEINCDSTSTSVLGFWIGLDFFLDSQTFGGE